MGVRHRPALGVGVHEYWAHTGPSEGDGGWQSLRQHLTRTSGLARDFGGRIGIPEFAGAAGLLHDVGKYSDEFQEYLVDSDALRKKKGATARLGRGVDHKLLGASAAAAMGGACVALAPVIAGHHGGLLDLSDAQASWSPLDPAQVRDRIAHDGVIEGPVECDALRDEVNRHSAPGSPDVLLRMAYSCLVDADGLDTEAHDRPSRSAGRGHDQTMESLRDQLVAKQAIRIANAPASEVNRVRAEVYADCLAAAKLPPGCFRLTVPTGGGKTLSSLAFALSHAAEHDLDRVIYAIPYTSIIDQTVEVFRGEFADERTVLAHHALAFEPMCGVADVDSDWSRLAADNWNAPVVVTTNVQFFESVLGSRPGRSRKVHRIARSVIVLDEVQTLPPALLDPILDTLRCLVDEWGATVLLCSATQPAVGDADRPGVALPDVREIIQCPEDHFRALERVKYVVPDEPWSWNQVAEEMRSSPSVLSIVNTRADALDLLDALDDPEALHLSTLLTPRHRKVVLDLMMERLRLGVPCRVVSTQVIEAGVDIDFPLVLRAVGPLDSIIQAAGRCNREGRLPKGRVVVFEPSEGHWSPGVYRTGTELARKRLRADPGSLHSPAASTDYFRSLYESVDTDSEGIQRMRRRCEFRQVDEHFHLISEDTVPVLITSKSTEMAERALASGRYLSAHERVEIQANSVSVRRRELLRLERERLVAALDVRATVYHWVGAEYDPVRGLGRMTEESGALIV